MQAAGFNAFNQLSDQEGDVWKFEAFGNIEPTSTNIPGPELFFPSWSSTALKHGSGLQSRGFQNFTTQENEGNNVRLTGPFGDLNGLIGYLDSEARVHYLTESETGERTTPFNCPGGSEAPPISNLALAGNERVAVTFKQAPNARLTHVAEFTSLLSFKKWHADPSNTEYYPAEHHMLQGRPKQLLANAGNFILLMEDGEVYTWGDPRFRTLARPTVGQEAVAADKPGLVEALGGLNIASVQCGPGVGWLASALSTDGALYLWGTTTPGEEGVIRCLADAGPGEVALVDIVSGPDAEPADVVSAAVGRNHIAVVTDAGQLFVAGDNSNGQLGLGKDQPFVEDWAHVEFVSDIRQVHCGPKATFVLTS